MNKAYNTVEAFETVPNSIDAKLAPAVHALAVLNASTREPFFGEVRMKVANDGLTTHQRHYQKHKEEHKAESRARYKKDPEKVKAYNAKWRKEHPGYDKEWWAKNGKATSARSRRKRLMKDPEVELKYARRYRKTVRGRSVHSRRNVIQRCKHRGIPCSLSIEWFVERMETGCELTGIPFVLDKGWNIYSPSVDRIDPNEGYTPENSRMILMSLNAFKENGTDEDMVRIATALIERHKVKI